MLGQALLQDPRCTKRRITENPFKRTETHQHEPRTYKNLQDLRNARGTPALAAELRSLLSGSNRQRGLALTAVLPGAAVRRGDGELLAALGDTFAERATAYVAVVN